MEVQTMNDESGIEFLLASLSAAEAAENARLKADEVVIEKDDEELDEDLLADLEATVARAEVYAAQEATIDPTPVPTTAPSKPARQKKAVVASTPRLPRKSLGDLDESVFEIVIGAPVNKAAVIAARPSQVKVAEKFDNLFLALAAGKEPSSYVTTALKVLTKTGTMTSADLIAAYKADDLSDGTARSQTGQIMELFNVVGIALRSGQSLTLRQDSSVAKRLLAIMQNVA